MIAYIQHGGYKKDEIVTNGIHIIRGIMNSNGNGSKPSQDPKRDLNQPYSSDTSRLSSPELPSSTSSSSNSSSNQSGSSSDYSQKDKYRRTYGELEGKVKNTIHSLKESEAYHYAVSNKEQTVTYILLALGILLLFFNPLFGEIIVGLVAGYHFAPQIVYYLRNLSQIFEGQDQLRYIVLTGTLIALFITAPGIFIGAVIAALFKQFIFSNRNTTNTIRTDEEIESRGSKNNFGSNRSQPDIRPDVRSSNGNGNKNNFKNKR